MLLRQQFSHTQAGQCLQDLVRWATSGNFKSVGSNAQQLVHRWSLAQGDLRVCQLGSSSDPHCARDEPLVLREVYGAVAERDGGRHFLDDAKPGHAGRSC